MKKLLTFLLALLIALGTAACRSAFNEPPATADPEPVQISAFNEFGGSTVLFKTEDSLRILELLEGDWADSLTDCAADIFIHLPDGYVRYHSDCGTFIDVENQRSLSLSEAEHEEVNTILSRYITLGVLGPIVFENDWGITLTLDNLSRSGATIVCTQSGGNPTGELTTGSYFVIEQLGPDNGWKPLDYLELEGELAWTAEARLVNMDGTTEWEVNWEWLYGELPNGHYRIGKEFMDFRGTGDYDTMMIYAEFSFGEMPIEE